MATFVMTSTIPDLWLLLCSCFAKWIRIKIIMVLLIIWCIINLGMSGWLYMSSAGDFGSVTFDDGTNYSDWTTSVCGSSPYMYMAPFSFTFTKSSGYTSSTATTCGFPFTSSIIRFVIGSVSVVSLIILFFKTPVSVIARQILAIVAFLYFTVFILDCNDVSTGSTSCTEAFPNTDLHNELASKSITLNCDSSNYAGLAVIDLMLATTFLILHSAWAMTKDLYVVKK